MDDWWTTGTRMISKEADIKSAKANLADIDAGDRQVRDQDRQRGDLDYNANYAERGDRKRPYSDGNRPPPSQSCRKGGYGDYSQTRFPDREYRD